MNCRRVEQLLSDHLEDLLSPRESGAVATHMRDCPSCRHRCAEYRSLLARMRDLRQHLPVPGPEIERRSIERWLAASKPAFCAWPQSKIQNPKSKIQCAAAAATLALTLLGLLLVRWHDHRAPGQPAPSLVQRPDSGRPAPRMDPVPRPPLLPSERRIAVSPLPAPGGSGRSALSAGPFLPGGAEESARSKPALRSRQRGGRPGANLSALNGTPSAPRRPWQTRSQDRWEQIEAQMRGSVPVRDDFVSIPFPRLAATADTPIAAAVESYKREAAVVDARLARPVTCAFKATALADLCDQLRGDTGIHLAAGRSVADEKVTLFGTGMPLRDLMRQLSRPFGYAWIRSRKDGEYRYELAQDLRSQLMEEELRNRDRHAALLALDREVERFRPYLDLTPDEALARSKTAPPAEKALLERMAGYAWGAIQMYFRLSSQDLAAMRAGHELVFRARPEPGVQPLPSDLQPGVLQSFRDWTVVKHGDGYRMAFEVANPSSSPVPVPALPGAHASVRLSIAQSDLGRTTLTGWAGWGSLNSQGEDGGAGGSSSTPCATGISPAVLKPDNAKVNAKLAREPALRVRVSVRPRPSCALPPDPNAADPRTAEPRVTTADVLEALHQATGLPIVADYYTRLYKPEEVLARNQTLFDALNMLADTMRMRWQWEGSWLQFRSTSYYDDRLKEIPNRLLTRWAASRRQQGTLMLDDLVEIAQLSDAQLDAREMGEGAKAAFGLREWDLGNSTQLRPHLRFLAGFTPAHRQEAMSPAGLLFTRMPLAQQQRFITLALGSGGAGLQSFEDLAGSALRVEYTRPGGFQWGEAGHPGQGHYTRWVIPLEPGPQGRRVLRPIVQERTREAALQAVRRVDLNLRQALLEEVRCADPRLEASPAVVEEGQIYPTRLDLCFVYMPGATNARSIQLQTSFANYGIRPH